MKKSLITSIFSILFIFISGTLSAQLKLPAMLRDSMVLQRNTELKIWGWAEAGEQVEVSFKGNLYQAEAGRDGKWMVHLPPMEAGGPYIMEISARGSGTPSANENAGISGTGIKLENILVGDVWLCAGQSNMVHYMALHSERYAEEIAQAGDPEIRQFLVPSATSLEGPQEDLAGGSWKSANPDDIMRFSVVAYFFARNLHETYGVPIGIINASVGGTPIEAWTSAEGLKEFPVMQRAIEMNSDTAYVSRVNRAAWSAMREGRRETGQDEGLAGPVAWYDPAYVPENWHRINIPGYWEDQGIRDLNGVVWYRREFEVPASMTGIPAKVALGRIVDADQLYINGEQVGRTTYQYPQRRYEVPVGVLKSDKNLFVIRVTNQAGKGGFVPDKPYYLSAAGETIDLKGYWQYRVGEVYPERRFSAMGISAQNQPAALYNAMIAPFTDYAVKGFVWYQGESNAGRPEEYRLLQRAQIRDWRSLWGQGDLPFLYAQLPNFMEVNYSPEESDWAMLREAQMEAMDLPATGMAVTIDLGEWNDIHPDNKKPVGDRLALWARKIAYGEEDLVYSGPIYQSYRIEGDKIILTFDHAGSGLVSGNGEPPGHFAIAGPDKNFVWGHAEIVDQDKVAVWHEDIPDPVYVRYAWADNPRFANLYNKEGLPASPFRTDH
ncbi:MAG TPA: sialate O-acetylesterase [Bacteroides sp.]|nr:sialate O-acetylesterase [Bacteroides sp.]